MDAARGSDGKVGHDEMTSGIDCWVEDFPLLPLKANRSVALKYD